MRKIQLCFLVSFLLIGFLVSAFSVSFAVESPIKVRIAHLFPKEHFVGQKMDWIANELERRSDGRFKCEVFHGGTAGGEKENLEDLLLGNIELMAGAGSYFYHYCPEANVSELPFYRWKDRAEALKVVRGYWPKFVEVAERKGFYPVGLEIRDFWGVWNRTPITSLDVLKNAKFRSINSDYWIEVTKLYGAIPNPMPGSDAYMAFKTGVCDGYVCSLSAGVSFNFHEVLKCFVNTKFSLCLTYDLTSTKWLNSLPAELREIFLEVCRESDEVNLLVSEKQLREYKEKALKAGVVIVEIDTEALRKKALLFRDEYMKKKGPEVYKFYKDWIVYLEGATGRPQQ